MKNKKRIGSFIGASVSLLLLGGLMGGVAYKSEGFRNWNWFDQIPNTDIQSGVVDESGLNIKFVSRTIDDQNHTVSITYSFGFSPDNVNRKELESTLTFVGETEEVIEDVLEVSINYNPQTIVITKKGDFSTIARLRLQSVASENVYAILNIYPNEHVPTHNVFNVELWNENVDHNSYLVKQSDTSYTEFHASKDEDGIYVYAEQYVKELKTDDYWFGHDNIELRYSEYKTDHYDTTQIFASTYNGGTFNGCSGYVTTNPVKNNDDLYRIEYEIVIPYENGFSSDQDLVLFAGTNLKEGWSFGDGGWFDSSSLYSYTYHITENGLTRASGTELIANPVIGTSTDATWKSNIFNQIVMDGSESFELSFDFNVKLHGDVTNWATGFAADLYSDNWANGGLSFRNDWYAWSRWVTHDGLDGSMTLNKRLPILADNDWVDFHKDLDVHLCVSFMRETNNFEISMACKSNYEGYEGMVCIVQGITPYCITLETYNGPIHFQLGLTDITEAGCSSEITINSAQVLSGTRI